MFNSPERVAELMRQIDDLGGSDIVDIETWKGYKVKGIIRKYEPAKHRSGFEMTYDTQFISGKIMHLDYIKTISVSPF